MENVAQALGMVFAMLGFTSNVMTLTPIMETSAEPIRATEGTATVQIGYAQWVANITIMRRGADSRVMAMTNLVELKVESGG